ncbi:putative transcription factor bHLH84-like [Capsicum annuum]|nr:putative transcription factor bHLH84-like [Capsicum annuum]
MSNYVPENIVEHIRNTMGQCKRLNQGDKPRWTVTNTGLFTVKNAWESLRKREEGNDDLKRLWSKNLPFKFSFLAWRIWKGKVPVAQEMHSWNYDISQFCRCCDNEEVESIEHLFLKGNIAQKVWRYFSVATSFNPMLNLKLTIRKWWSIDGNGRLRGVFQVVPIIILWFVWKRRNTMLQGGTSTIGIGDYQIDHFQDIPSMGKNILILDKQGEQSSRYLDSSDEDDVLGISSDSDYIGSSDEDETDEANEASNLLNEAQASGVLDNNLAEEVRSVIKKSQKSNKKKEEQVVEEEHEDWVMNEVGGGGEVDDGYLLLMGRIEDRKKNRDKNKKKRPTLKWEIWEEENDRWMAVNYTNDLDFNSQSELGTETTEPPSDLITPLLRYQKEWLAWALKQEESTARGGILADEMGMGKTVQAIALVLAKRELGQAVSDSSLLSPAPCTSQELPAVKGTLVVCPVVAVIQWVSEIDRFTTKGSNKILVYHGANREKNIEKFAEYDFVITTYSTVEAEYRKNVMPPKQKCEWCGKAFYEQKLSVHQKYFCGPDAVKTANQSKQQSKKSKPGGRMSKLKKDSIESKDKTNSDSEIDTRGRGRGKGIKRKSETDSSSIDNSASIGQDMSMRKSILHSVKWNRIILDEAHYVKDRRCNTTRAILALESSYKWALSGTPLQNRVGELYSLYIASPIQSQGNHGTGRDAMVLLKHKILKSILLRRTKKGRAADLALPPRIVTLRKDSLDVKEEDYYTSLYNESQAQFNTYIQAGTLMNNYAHIFDLLTRLRQV